MGSIFVLRDKLLLPTQYTCRKIVTPSLSELSYMILRGQVSKDQLQFESEIKTEA